MAVWVEVAREPESEEPYQSGYVELEGFCSPEVECFSYPQSAHLAYRERERVVSSSLHLDSLDCQYCLCLHSFWEI